jgi:hypothetical protein
VCHGQLHHHHGDQGMHVQGGDCMPFGTQQGLDSTQQDPGSTQQGPSSSTPGSQQDGSQPCHTEQVSSQGSGGDPQSGAIAALRAELAKERRLRQQVRVWFQSSCLLLKVQHTLVAQVLKVGV